MVSPEHYVNADDVGRLHVAAALLPHVQDQRIFAFAGRYSWDSILEIMRGLDPARDLPADFSGGEDPNEIEPRHKAEALLREMGRPGWTSLAESVADNVRGVDGSEKKSSIPSTI
ncbi:hypothetical protein IMZ48_37210 [Candidatus Bathyarchaeota archaeon]|nr:hypothetical protein [Candidatus Bathyarchaeota archaeon]